MVALSLFAAIGGLGGLVAAQSSYNNSATYTNPILDGEGADPWVIQDGKVRVMRCPGLGVAADHLVLLHDIHHECQHYHPPKHHPHGLEQCRRKVGLRPSGMSHQFSAKCLADLDVARSRLLHGPVGT